MKLTEKEYVSSCKRILMDPKDQMIDPNIVEDLDKLKKSYKDGMTNEEVKTKLQNLMENKGFNNSNDPEGNFITQYYYYIIDEYPTTRVLDIVANCAEDNAVEYLVNYLKLNKFEPCEKIDIFWCPMQWNDDKTVVIPYCPLCELEFPSRIKGLLWYLTENEK